MNIILNRFLLFLLFICLLPEGRLSAQGFPPKNYPSGFFRNPLEVPINLSGNFGELRPNHYHMGLDLKTLQRENLRVFAAADGYIARIKIEPAGFGRAIYINHPNGYTTLYAHLNDFSPALEAFVKDQQYRQEKWNVFLEVPSILFPVKRGDFIAYSGNTGGSQAPHVHFEIRRTLDDVNLNPMLFGFPLPDNTKPIIVRLAIYDRSKSVYEQSPRIIPLKRSAAGYITSPETISSSAEKISFGISSYDTHSGSSNQNGIYEAMVYDNGKLVSGFQMDNISYDDTRYLNAHIDYKTRTNGGPYIQHLSPLPGYMQSIYTKSAKDGVIDLSDGNSHPISISTRDAYGNTSTLSFSIRYNGAKAVSKEMPGKMFYPLMLEVFESEDCEFFMGENCLYDSVHISHASTLSSNPAVHSRVHTIGAPYIPVHDSFTVRLKALPSIAGVKKERVVMQRFAGAKKDVQKVDWQNDWACARFRDFGNYQLILDEEPPVITPIGISNGANLSRSTRISFAIKDNLERFKNFRAELDGKWLRFTNDKGKVFHYRFDEHCPPGQHELKIYVEDEAGNVSRQVYKFTR